MFVTTSVFPFYNCMFFGGHPEYFDVNREKSKRIFLDLAFVNGEDVDIIFVL